MQPTSCRPDAAAYEYYQYGPGPYHRPELYVDNYAMPNGVMNARMREGLKYVKRSPYIPDEMEVSYLLDFILFPRVNQEFCDDYMTSQVVYKGDRMVKNNNFD